jgi:hypothetical protein
MSNEEDNNIMTDADLESVDMEDMVMAPVDVEDKHAPDPTEPTTTPVGLEPVGSERSHDRYVSLDISRDSDEDKKKSVYHKTTTVC